MFEKIRKIVKQIPKGKVATYGQIAKMAGIRDARIVGWALHSNKNQDIPCHRVVNKDGLLAKNYAMGGWREQRKRLEKEGVKFTKNNRVDLKKQKKRLGFQQL